MYINATIHTMQIAKRKWNPPSAALCSIRLIRSACSLAKNQEIWIAIGHPKRFHPNFLDIKIWVAHIYLLYKLVNQFHCGLFFNFKRNEALINLDITLSIGINFSVKVNLINIEQLLIQFTE